MKRFIFVPFFVLSLAFQAFAQDPVEKCMVYFSAGDYQNAIKAGKEATRIQPKNASAHLCLGSAYYKTGELDLALESLKKAETYAVNKHQLADVYKMLGLTYFLKMDHDNALLYYNRHLKLSRELGDQEAEATALNGIAGIFLCKSEFDKALCLCEQALNLTTDECKKATIHDNIAFFFYAKKEYSKAIDNYKKAIEMATRCGDYHTSSQIMLNLGDLYREIKDFDNAYSYLTEGLKGVQKVGDKPREAFGYSYLGQYFIDRGDKGLAKDNLKKAYELFKAIGLEKMAQGTLSLIKQLDQPE